MNDLYDLAEAMLLRRRGGGGGGTSDYNALSNKPQINGNTLSGDQSPADLGIAEPSLSSNGDIYFGSNRVARVMDKDSYDALTSKENIYYLTYPTPTPSRETKSESDDEPAGIKDDVKEPPEEPDIKKQLKELIEEPEPDIKNGGNS